MDGNGDRDSILGNFSQGKMLRLDRRRWRWFSTPLTISTIYWVPVIFVAVTSPSGGGMVSDGLGVGTLDLSKIVSYAIRQYSWSIQTRDASL